MAITMIETITLTTPVGTGIYRKDFQSFLWVHIDQAPWRQQISFDVFGSGGLVLLTPGLTTGSTPVIVIDNTTGLTNIPVTTAGEQLIRGVYKTTATDPGIEFWVSILVGGIDYNPSSSFPQKRDDFGPMKIPATVADIPAIDYYQYLTSVSTKSQIDLNVLKSLKETLTPKMILAKDINWLRNAVIAVEKVYYDLVEKINALQNALNQLTLRVDDLELRFEALRNYVYNELEPRVATLEKKLPDGLKAARSDIFQRVFVNLSTYGSGNINANNPTDPEITEESELYKTHQYAVEDSGQAQPNLSENFRTLVVHPGIKGNPSGAFTIIQSNKFAMFTAPTTNYDDYETALRTESNGQSTLQLSRKTVAGAIEIGGSSADTSAKLILKRNSNGAWLVNKPGAVEGSPGIAMTQGGGTGIANQLGLLGDRMMWTGADGGSSKMTYAFGKAGGDPYIYHTYGVGNINKEGFIIVKAQNGGASLVFTGDSGKSCGINMSAKGLKIWGLSEDGITKIAASEGGDDEEGEGTTEIKGEGMEATPDEVADILNQPQVVKDMYGGGHNPMQGF